MGGFSVTTETGRLMAAYRPAAILKNCELVRVTEDDGTYESHFSAVILWRDAYWVRHATHLVMLFQGAEWTWTPVSIRDGDFKVGDTVTGVVQGDPVVTRSRS